VSSNGSRCFLIEVEASWLQGLREHGVSFDGPILSGAPEAYWLAKKVHEEFASAGDEVSALSIHGLTLALAAALTRASIQGSSGNVPRWFRDVVDLLRSRCTEKLTLTFLADTAGVHPVYLASAFRRHQGCTNGAYVRKLRIEHACREMLRPEVALSDIALSVGFSDQSHFSRTFKRLVGVSPAEFRRSMNRRSSFRTTDLKNVLDAGSHSLE
jgi:AraC family transcriptional regulator